LSQEIKVSKTIFEDIKRVDGDGNDNGNEYWSARDLSKILGYTEYRNFIPVIQKAIQSCKNSNAQVGDHFVEVHDMVKIGSGAERKVEDIHLSRYACYLIVQNADPTKEIVALGQTYFAIFQNHGYKGLYGGLDAKGIHNKKELKKSQNILDHMGSTELAANLFRATQTEEKINRENIKGKDNANKTHYAVGKKVRKTIAELGGTMPEDLPVHDSIKKIEKGKKVKSIPDKSGL
jgi:DNA-damage-inducible protein D